MGRQYRLADPWPRLADHALITTGPACFMYLSVQSDLCQSTQVSATTNMTHLTALESLTHAARISPEHTAASLSAVLGSDLNPEGGCPTRARWRCSSVSPSVQANSIMLLKPDHDRKSRRSSLSKCHSIFGYTPKCNLTL